MKNYYKGLFVAAAILGSIVGESNSYKLKTDNIIFKYLPLKIQNQLEGPVAASSGALTGDLLLLMVLEQYIKRKKG